MRVVTVPLFALAVALAVAGCGGAGSDTTSPSGPASQVAYLRISPDTVFVSFSDTTQFIVEGTSGSGGVVSLGPVTWTADPPDAVTLNASGQVIAGDKLDFDVTITARSGTAFASARMIIMPNTNYHLTGAAGMTSLPASLGPMPCTFGSLSSAPVTIESGQLSINSGPGLVLHRQQDCGGVIHHSTSPGPTTAGLIPVTLSEHQLTTLYPAVTNIVYTPAVITMTFRDSVWATSYALRFER